MNYLWQPLGPGTRTIILTTTEPVALPNQQPVASALAPPGEPGRRQHTMFGFWKWMWYW
jgi:hypothetical protein